MEKSKVYFTKKITPEAVVKIYETLGANLGGKVAVKLHSGEQGNQNYICEGNNRKSKWYSSRM